MTPLTKGRQMQLDIAQMDEEHENLEQMARRNLQHRSSNPSANPPEQIAPFFTKLPLELRRAIYIALIGNNVAHLWNSGYHKIEHWLCVCPEVCGSRSLSGLSEAEEHSNCKAKGRKGCFLPLLQTCRQINDEALPLLYETIAFHISGALTVFELSESLSPLALSSIQRLSIVVSEDAPNFEPDTKPTFHWLSYWDSLCLSLSNLSSLRVLFIEFYLSDQNISSQWSEAEVVAYEVLEPLIMVHQESLRKFEVRGNWDELRVAAMVGCAGLEDAPFKVFGQDHLFEPLLQAGMFESEKQVIEVEPRY